jgi:hypothetical protein
MLPVAAIGSEDTLTEEIVVTAFIYRTRQTH